MLRLLFFGLAVAAAMFATSASASIVVQRGIAGVSIGMSQRQVRTVLGKPRHAVRLHNTFGAYVEYRYPRLRLDFQGSGPLTNVSTTRPDERTASGIGIGSTRAQVDNKVRSAHCKVQFCVVGNALPGTIVTTFYLRRGLVIQVTVGRVID